MQDNEQKKALAEIFKDEDFDSLKSGEGSDEDSLDEALDEIAELKKTMAVNQGYFSPEPAPVAPPRYQSDEGAAARTIERKTEEIISAIERNRLSAQTDSEIRQINNELRELKNKVYSYNNEPKAEKPEPEKPQSDIVASLTKLEYDVALTRNELVSIRKALDGRADNPAQRTDPTLLGEIAVVRQALGSGDEISRKSGDALAALYIECERIGALVKSEAPLGEKIKAVGEFGNKIATTENVNVSPIVEVLNDIISDINDLPMRDGDVEALFDYVRSNSAEAYLEISRKDVEYYLTLSSEVRDHNPEDCLDLLKDALNFKNRVCGGVGAAENEKQYEYLENIVDTINGNADREHAVFLRNKAIKLVDRLLVLRVKDVYEFRSVKVEKTYETGDISPKTVFDYVKEISDSLGSLAAGAAGAAISVPASATAFDKDALVGEIIDKTVAQLDRLFEDVKNLTESLGTNLLENLSIINDNVNVLKNSIDGVSEKIDGLKTAPQEDVKAGENEENSEAQKIAEEVEVPEKQEDVKTGENEENSEAQKIAEEVETPEKQEEKPLETAEKEELSEKADEEKGEPDSIDYEAKFAELKDALESLRQKGEESEASLKGEIEFFKEEAQKSEQRAAKLAQDNEVLLGRLDEIVALLTESKAENASVKAELAEIKEKVASAVTPDALDTSIKKSMNKLKNELGGLRKQVARAKRDDEIEIDEILGQVDDALAAKKE